MTERPGWWPPTPDYAILLPHPDEAEEGWNEGVEAGVKAVIGRIEILCYAMDANTTWCMSSADWLQLRKEAGLE